MSLSRRYTLLEIVRKMPDEHLAFLFGDEPADVEIQESKPPIVSVTNWFKEACDICHSPYQRRK